MPTQPETEMVPASEVSVGDKIHFPNSRQAQVVDSLSIEGDNVRLVSADATWVVSRLAEIRKEKIDGSADEE